VRAVTGGLPEEDARVLTFATLVGRRPGPHPGQP
jgi:hypothetical protein